MAARSLPSPELLRQLLRYEPATGKLFWLPREPSMFVSGRLTAEHHCALFNGKFAGQEALTSDNGDGYRSGGINGKNLKAHRVIWAMVHDRWPSMIDHIDGDRSNNRIDNLRLATIEMNSKNKRRYTTSRSGVVGVNHTEIEGVWQATIMVGGRRFGLGRYSSIQQAAEARRAAELRHGFHLNHGKS